MKPAPDLFVVFLLLFVVWIKKGLAISCYQCNSKTDPDCKEFFDHSTRNTLTVKSTECSVDAAEFCIKTTGVWGGVVGTTRFCSSRDMGNQCQFINYPDHDRVYRACIHTCHSDHCNTAENIYSTKTFLVMIFTSILAYILH